LNVLFIFTDSTLVSKKGPQRGILSEMRGFYLEESPFLKILSLCGFGKKRKSFALLVGDMVPIA